MKDVGIHIENMGGNCPVQAEGFIDGKEFYFRARGQRWSIGIGGEPVSEPEWYYEEEWGNTPYAAGWMPQYVALAMIAKAVEKYANA
jgi:hypothetical protein